MDIFVTVSGAWSAFATKVGAFMPQFFAALVILILGWIACNLVKVIAVRLLKLVQFDNLADKSGISHALELGGVRQKPSEILSLLIFWFFFLIVIVATLDTLSLPGVKEALEAVFLYIPKIVAAIVVLILGLYLANFLETVTRTSCASSGLAQAETLGRVAYYATAVFLAVAILEILKIASEIVTWAFLIVFGAICLALAIAFGVGGREVAARYLERWLEQRNK